MYNKYKGQTLGGKIFGNFEKILKKIQIKFWRDFTPNLGKLVKILENQRQNNISRVMRANSGVEPSGGVRTLDEIKRRNPLFLKNFRKYCRGFQIILEKFWINYEWKLNKFSVNFLRKFRVYYDFE